MQTVQTSSQWVLEWTWPQMPQAVAEGIAAWLTSLKGQVGTFRYAPRQSAVSPISGIVTRQRAFAYNDTISVSGFSPSAATGLRLGQFFQIGTQLLQIVSAPALADINGAATISFEPELRLDYVANTSVNFSNPRGLFRLASADGVGFTLDPDKLPTFGTVQAKEAV
jgi:hypothetical protein